MAQSLEEYSRMVFGRRENLQPIQSSQAVLLMAHGIGRYAQRIPQGTSAHGAKFGRSFLTLPVSRSVIRGTTALSTDSRLEALTIRTVGAQPARMTKRL